MLDMGFEQIVRSILGQTCSGMRHFIYCCHIFFLAINLFRLFSSERRCIMLFLLFFVSLKSLIFCSSSNGHVQCYMAFSSSSLGAGIYGSQPYKSLYFHFLKAEFCFYMLEEEIFKLVTGCCRLRGFSCQS